MKCRKLSNARCLKTWGIRQSWTKRDIENHETCFSRDKIVMLIENSFKIRAISAKLTTDWVFSFFYHFLFFRPAFSIHFLAFLFWSVLLPRFCLFYFILSWLLVAELLRPWRSYPKRNKSNNSLFFFLALSLPPKVTLFFFGLLPSRLHPPFFLLRCSLFFVVFQVCCSNILLLLFITIYYHFLYGLLLLLLLLLSSVIFPFLFLLLSFVISVSVVGHPPLR